MLVFCKNSIIFFSHLLNKNYKKMLLNLIDFFFIENQPEVVDFTFLKFVEIKTSFNDIQ